MTKFEQFHLSAPLLKALAEMNFVEPSPIQEKAIPHLIDNKDVIGLAQTGTGKTAAFALPVLNYIDVKISAPQVLILAPTRELAIQVAAQIEALGKYVRCEIAVLCGGQDYRKQLMQLRSGAHIVVGTPGRVLESPRTQNSKAQ